MALLSPSPIPTAQREFQEQLVLGSKTLPLRVVRNPRARRYLLRLSPDSSVRLTVPRGGSLREARAFLERNLPWLERTAERLAARPTTPRQWLPGTSIFWRGDLMTIQELPGEPDRPYRVIEFGSEILRVPQSSDLRAAIERHIWSLARKELPALVASSAQLHGLRIQRVTIRNQRSRWGSCSRRGVISLNWRILQAPNFVRDYLIIHELMHLREMNHSRLFWFHVAAACPEYRTADTWLSRHSHLLAR